MPSFWDMQKRLSEQRRPARPQPAASAPADRDSKPLTISQLASRIRAVLKEGLASDVVVRGEVSEWMTGPSGHRYFTLKDARASVRCLMWQSDAASLRFEPRVGQELVATGVVDTYPDRSQYQLKCSRLDPIGQGAGDLEFRQLIALLDREGLFETSRKKPLPAYPQRIAIVTSAQAAGYQDVLKVFRGFRFLSLYHLAVPVQGEGAGERIAEALALLSKQHGQIGGVDVVILVRGGGSVEDLAAFNQEPVARALGAMSIPVITGIGHQTDRTLADMVADHEAHTPTEAAQVLVRNWKSARDRIEQMGIILRRDWRNLQEHRKRDLDNLSRHEIFRRPAESVNRWRRKVDELGFALARAIRQMGRRTGERLRGWAQIIDRAHPRQRIQLERGRVAELAGRLDQAQQRQHVGRRLALETVAWHLEAVDPGAVLRRGYSMTFLRRTGGLLLRAAAARPGDVLLTRTAEGEVQSTVGKAKQGDLFE